MSEAKTLTRDEISAAIAEKAWHDESFHKEVLANANQAYEKYLGRPVPPGMTIKVLEDTPTLVHFVLPAKPAESAELSDEDLEKVAGGATPAALLVTVTMVGGIVAVAEGRAKVW